MPQTDMGVLLFIGAIFFLIGLLGGGFEISAIKIPSVGKYPRFLSLGIGTIFMGIAVIRLIFPPVPLQTGVTPTTTTPAATAVVAEAKPTESVQQLEPAEKTVTPTDTPVPEPPDTPKPTNIPTPAASPTLIPTPNIPIYDDFENGTIDYKKWGPPTWGNPQQYTPIEAEGVLKFEISDKWADWMIPDRRPIQEVYTLITVEQTSNGSMGFTIGNDNKRYGLFIQGRSRIMTTDIDKELEFFGIPETCCPSTYLLGARSDANQIHFYVDGNLVASYLLNGYPDLMGLQIIGDGNLTSTYVSDVWVSFKQ